MFVARAVPNLFIFVLKLDRYIEINELDLYTVILLLYINDDVVWLEISMTHGVRVQVTYDIAKLDKNVLNRFIC